MLENYKILFSQSKKQVPRPRGRKKLLFLSRSRRRLVRLYLVSKGESGGKSGQSGGRARSCGFLHPLC